MKFQRVITSGEGQEEEIRKKYTGKANGNQALRGLDFINICYN